jgi:hypothetical protein
MRNERAEGMSGTLPPRGRGRRVGFTVATVIFAVASFGGLFGVGIVIGWFDNEMGGIHRVHDLEFGILYGVILTVAFVTLAWRPADKPSVFLQIVAVAIAGAVASIVAADPLYLVVPAAVAVAAGVLFALHPDRSTVLHPRATPSTLLAAFVAIGAVPLIWLGLSAARLQREGAPADPHVSMDHWVNMAAMAFGLVLVAAVATCRIPGWRISAWCSGLGLTIYGIASIVFHRLPGVDVPYAGSEGVGWGVVAVIGGLAFIVAVEWDRRRFLGSGEATAGSG